MKISFAVGGFTPEEGAFANTRALFEAATREIRCPIEWLDEVAVADEANFGAVIQRIAPGLPHTNNEHYVAVAKTIPLPATDGKMPSSVVLRDFVLGGAVAALGKDFADRTADEQRLIYSVWHEVGHVRDNAERVRDNTPTGITDPLGRFRVNHVADFFRGAVLSETAACRFAALAYTQELYDLEQAHDNQVIEDSLVKLRADAKAYTGDPDELYRLGFHAAQTFWLPFVQYGECIAHLHGNGSLKAALSIWGTAKTEAEQVILDYGRLLRTLFSSYPVVPGEFAAQLFGLWVKLAGCYGFRFVADDEKGDGVFWNLGP